METTESLVAPLIAIAPNEGRLAGLAGLAKNLR
jgi:hypothetical protein